MILAKDSLLSTSLDGATLARLRGHRPSLIHVVDPFKVPREEAVEKAKAVQQYGFPALILASTDWRDFEAVIGPYVAAVRQAAPGLSILLHFPPRPGSGMPMVAGADATLYPFLLGSVEPYFAWQSYVETAEQLAAMGDARQRRPPELIHLAALTFGQDLRSHDVMALEPVVPLDSTVDLHLEMIRVLGLHGAYLFSRHEAVPEAVSRRFRNRMPADKILFVSGGIRTPEQANRFLDAGADFVVFCGALERDDWRQVLENLVRGWRGGRTSP